MFVSTLIMRNTCVRFILCAIFFTVWSSLLVAQQNQHPVNEHEQCGTQQWLETQMKAYPGLKQQYEQMEKKLGDAVTQKLQIAKAASHGPVQLNALMADAPVFSIPIVFHIVHTSPSSITDAQIYALLDTLNKDFSGTNGDSVKIPAAFKPFFGKSNIRFCLAQRTPAGAATNGIMRYTSSTISSGSGSSNDPIKSSSAGGADAWAPNKYLNVWIGTFSSSGLLGYASFPITSPENPGGLLSQQGLVIEKGTIPGGSITGYNNGRVLTHEAGHYFWIRHIWGDGFCADDFPNTPGIDDTPPASGPSSGCGTGVVATGCSGSYPDGRMYRNYMDYSNSDCMAMFSVGQTIRMAITLDSFRVSLKTSNGCEPVTCPPFNINVTSTGPTSSSVTVTGGQPPYSYSLDSINYQLSNQLTGLTPGNTYTVYVRDSVYCKGRTSFIVNGIIVSPLPAHSLCVNQAITVNFTTTGSFNAGNIFTAQLSNSSGSFANPVNIGTITATGSGAINATIPDTMPHGMQYRIRVIASNPAIIGSNNGVNIEITNASIAPAVSIAVTGGYNPGCLGSSINFTATATNGGTAPIFQWKRNGVDVDTGKIYTTNSLADNDVITCSLVSNSTCATTTTALSNSITVVLASTLVPSVTIASNAADTICSGTAVVFTATPVNGGSTPLYQWRKNGVNVGNGTAVYTAANLANGDTVTCTLTSSILCATPVSTLSNGLSFVVIPSIAPSVLISSSAGTGICSGTTVSFTATPSNGGIDPIFQWKKNGSNVGTNSTVYTDNNLLNGDSITCVMTRTTPAVCLTTNIVASNLLKMVIQNCGTQLVSGNAFLKESNVEVAVGPCGNFASSVAAPSGFHPRGTGSVASQLGFVADTGKTGWNSYVGDYFLPGAPEEGFGLTINGTNYNNNSICASNTIPGSIISTQSGSLEKSATWQGNIGGLNITAKTFIPGGALFFVTRVTITNTSAAPVSNIYYMRNVDPDQGVSTPGSTGSSSTYNSIVSQTPNSCNSALVSATARINGMEYLGLGSKDPRARVTTGGFSNRSAINIWNGVGVSQSGTNLYGDNAISIAFNLGTLNVNETTSFSYAYILSTTNLEQALAATGITASVGGVAANIGKVTDVCSGTAVPINLGNTGNYTSWSWSPATGLDTIAGTTVYATVTSPIVYTATGTGSCGTIKLTIALNPVTESPVAGAGPITGPVAPVQGTTNVTYSISPVANAKGYTWKVPAGVIFNSITDTNVINVRMPAGALCDSISVTPRNACGTGAPAALGICVTSPYSITTGPVGEVCTVAPLAYLPYTATTGNPTVYSIVWDSAAIAAGFVNITNSALPVSQLPLTKPVGLAVGNYHGKISVGNSVLSSALYNFTVPVIDVPILVPAITIAASTSTNICAGTPVTFTATPVNGGTTPIYQWRKNGLVVGTGTATYTDNGIVNGDSITCILTSTASCVSPGTVTSNLLKFTVSSSAISSVSISSPFGNYACLGNTVTFTATAVNPGSSPILQWKKNGVAVATGTTYTTNSLATNDSIVCLLTSNNACSTSITVSSNVLIMDVATVTTPTVSGAVTIDCGQSATLNAIPTTAGNIINWYTAASGGASFSKGNSVSVTPASTTTYYAEAGSASGGMGKMVTAINTSGAVFVNHDAVTGDDHAGIVLSTNYAYVTGDNYTGRYAKSLSGAGVSLPLRDGFFSNLANGELWQLGTNSSNGSSFNYGTATRLYKLDENLTATGSFLTLSQPVTIGTGNFVAAGEGLVIIYSNTIFYRINLSDGTVTNMNGASGFLYTGSEGWASYGWAEFDGTNYFIAHVANYNTIAKRNVVTGAVSTIQVFSGGLGDMAAIIFDPQANRMYYHHEGGSQLGGSGETLGYVSVTSSFATPLCASNRVPVTVNVNVPSITPTVSIVSNHTGNICYGTSMTFTAGAVNGGTAPFYQWRRNGTNVGTGVTYTTSSLVNGDVISCVLTSSLFCVTNPMATSNNIVVSIITPSAYPSVSISSSASGNVCAGTNIMFAANAFNAGSTPVYQWKKNGINVGTNNPNYVDNALTGGSITCILTTNTPCATTITSNGIFISPVTPVTPSVSITSNSGNNICTGSTIVFTAIGVNAGSTPLYQWKKNGVNVGTGTAFSTNSLVTGDTISCVLISSMLCATPASVTSNAIGFTVNALPIIAPVANQFVCPGSTLPSVNFSGTGVQYRWTNNNPAIGLAASGVGNIPAFVANNTDSNAITATITATPVTAGVGYAYVANSANNTVSVIDLSVNAVVASIPVGASPWGVASAPDGSRVYVSHTSYLGSVSVINTANNQVIATLAVPGPSYGLCVSPDGSRLYVSNHNSTIHVFNTVSNTLINTYYIGGGNMFGLVVSPDGSKLYVAGSNNLYVLNSSGGFITNVPVGSNPIGVTISANGSRIYVSNSNSNTVSIINAATNLVMNTVVVGSSPYGLTLSPDGKMLYVANNGSNNVSVMNTATNEVVTTIAAGNAPSGISMSADGALVYVTNQNSNTVTVINAVDNSVAATVSGFSGPVSWGNFITSRAGCSGTATTFTIKVAAANYNTWVGEVSTDWHDAANWQCGRIPIPTDNVLIAISSKNFYPVIPDNDNITIKSLKLETGTSVTVGVNASLILGNGTGSWNTGNK